MHIFAPTVWACTAATVDLEAVRRALQDDSFAQAKMAEAHRGTAATDEFQLRDGLLILQATPWDTIQEKLRNHYVPKPSKIAARHAFYHRNQAEGESINNYTTALRQAAMHCEFRDLDDALMDRIVCGVRDIHLQRRLLAKPDLTLQKAIEEAVASEAAERSAQEIRKASSPRLARKPVPVHHEEASSDEASSSEDDDVHQTKRERRKFQQKSKGMCRLQRQPFPCQVVSIQRRHLSDVFQKGPHR
ncbi:Hypothetical predicted protein [Podarcis lilfordi]|uniref:Retrotransposon gag domain-containing protein n=1 Tax=Podarcis lilfordi TaxID=74358 RepID=A0AA35KYV4_9SAUR|nr:Hypothetical predicted protein [Podarcis lilfordi]